MANPQQDALDRIASIRENVRRMVHRQLIFQLDTLRLNIGTLAAVPDHLSRNAGSSGVPPGGQIRARASTNWAEYPRVIGSRAQSILQSISALREQCRSLGTDGLVKPEP